ncbi:hypothetical protein [Streptomyces rimosus]|uniref:hypothetical protein n=1 Tax=Streptomyces rimosus TaxID=1927 RepID=UPI00067C0D3B|nr:hypothetical protein [Streptomyces rimosus]
MVFYADNGARLTEGVKGTFTPEIWEAKLLQDLEEQTVFASPRICNTEYEGEFHKGGDTVRIPHFVDTVEDKGLVKAYGEIGSADHAQLEYMRMTVQKGSSFHLEIDSLDQFFTQPGIDKFSNLIRQRARKTAHALDKLVARTINHATANGKDFNSVEDESQAAQMKDLEGGPIDEFDAIDLADPKAVYNTVVDLMEELDVRSVPAERWLMVSPKVRSSILKSDMFIDASKLGHAVIPNGNIGEILGVPVYVTSALGSHTRPDRKKHPLINPAHTEGSGIDMVMGATNAVSVVTPMAQMDTYKPEKKFTDAVKSRLYYDAKVMRPEQMLIVASKPKPEVPKTKAAKTA